MIRPAAPGGALGEKYQELLRHLRGLEPPVIAFSGGVDSSFLLRAATDAFGAGVAAVLGRSPSVPEEILARAHRVAEAVGAALQVIESGEMENPRYRANTPDRCFHCKDTLFEALGRIRDAVGARVILDGTNLDDLSDTRPGLKAALRHGVRSPLAELGWTKPEIRSASRDLGLETWDLPSSPCLSSRIPHGAQVTLEALRMIDSAERSLRGLGFREVRVRHHGPLARIEVPPAALEALLGRRGEVVGALRRAGYSWITIDLEGYRTGGADPASGAGRPRG